MEGVSLLEILIYEYTIKESGLNIYVAEFLLGMIGSKRDLKQGMLGALTAGFNAGVLHPILYI
jgi:hypothetical protein